MKKFLVTLFMAIPIAAIAQQDPLYAQYLLNPALINPAWAGLNNEVTLVVAYRTQWVGLEGQPETLYFNAGTSLLDNRAGAALLVLNDRIGNATNQEMSVQFAYKLRFETVTFAFGMQAGVQAFDTDHAALNILDAGDNAFRSTERGSRMNIGAGMVLKSDRFFIGVSVPRLMPSTFRISGQRFRLYNQHFYVAGGYVHFVNEHLRFRPSVVFRGVKGAPVSVDFFAEVNVNAMHTVGVFTRNLNSYGVLLQTMVRERFRFGYVYEMPASSSAASAFNTHEIVLGMRLAVFSFQERAINSF